MSFTFTGDRAFLNAETIVPLLEPLEELVASGTTVTHMTFSGKSINIDAARILASRISSLDANTLVYFDFSDTVAGLGMEECLQVLSVILASLEVHAESLRHVDFSDNAIGSDGITHFEQFLRRCGESIESVAFNNDGMSYQAIGSVVDWLTEGRRAIPLKRFHLFNNMCDDEGAENLARLFKHCPNLTDVRVSATRVHGSGGNALIQGLEDSNSESIEKIDFYDNCFADDFGGKLAKILSKQSKMKSLNLNSIGMSLSSLMYLCSALIKSGCALEELDLSGNELGKSGMKYLLPVIWKMRGSLKKLILEENEFGNSPVFQLAELYAMKEGSIGYRSGEEKAVFVLETLNLGMNESSPALVLLLENLPFLERLELNGNYIAREAVVEIEKSMTECGKTGVLGDMDENLSDYEDEESDEGGEVDVEMLNAAFSNVHM